MPMSLPVPTSHAASDAYALEYKNPYKSQYLSGDYKITGDPNAKNDFLSRFDPAFNNFNFSSGGAGTGLYGSDLLDKLSGRVSGDLSNPETSLGMGLLKDQFSGQRKTAQQSLNDRYAGYGRGNGVQAAQQLALEDQMNKSESSNKRQMLSDILQQSIGNAMGLEGMKGGFYNDQQHRMGDQAQWQGNLQAGLLGNLASFLQGNSGQTASNQQQSFTNKLGLDQSNEAIRAKNFAADENANMPKTFSYSTRPLSNFSRGRV